MKIALCSGAYAFALNDMIARGSGENESGTLMAGSAGASMDIVVRGSYKSLSWHNYKRYSLSLKT